MFINELSVHANVNSKYITKFIEAYEHGKTFFVISELIGVDGYLEGVLNSGKELSPEFCRYTLFCVANAVKALHDKNLVNRSITPDTIACSMNGDIKIFDLSYARQLSDDALITYQGCEARRSSEVVQ